MANSGEAVPTVLYGSSTAGYMWRKARAKHSTAGPCRKWGTTVASKAGKNMT